MAIESVHLEEFRRRWAEQLLQFADSWDTPIISDKDVEYWSICSPMLCPDAAWYD